MNSELQNKLTELAFKRSNPFCYHCYHECPNGRCESCGSDDLMRAIPGVGCEYGTEWVIKSILETKLTTVDLAEEFEESIRQCYPEETQVGWMTFDTVTLMKEQDPISWSCAQSEWESNESEEGSIISLDGGTTYYRTHEVETLIELEL